MTRELSRIGGELKEQSDGALFWKISTGKDLMPGLQDSYKSAASVSGNRIAANSCGNSTDLPDSHRRSLGPPTGPRAKSSDASGTVGRTTAVKERCLSRTARISDHHAGGTRHHPDLGHFRSQGGKPVANSRSQDQGQAVRGRTNAVQFHLRCLSPGGRIGHPQLDRQVTRACQSPVRR